MFKVRATLPFHDLPRPLWLTYFLGNVFILIKIHGSKVLAEGWKSHSLHSSDEGCLVMSARAEGLRGAPKLAGTRGGGIELPRIPSS